MTYMGEPDHPLWLDNLAEDVTLEGAAMEGTADGAETVHSIVVTARTFYDEQEFGYAGDWNGDKPTSLRSTAV